MHDDMRNLSEFLKKEENFHSASEKIAEIQRKKILNRWDDLAADGERTTLAYSLHQQLKRLL